PVPSVPACAPPSPDTLSLHDALPISIVTGAALGYGLLFVIGPSDDPHAHHQHAAPAGAGFEAHLYGMYVALVLAAGLIGYFVSRDRKSTRLNSSHVKISYAVFCLEKK